MARLLIVVEVDVDPALVDPHEVADDIVETYREQGRHGGILADVTEMVSAEWRVSAPTRVEH